MLTNKSIVRSALAVRPGRLGVLAGSWWKSWRLWLLGILAIQYVVLQLLTGVEYLDAPRNMHWGVYLLEEPRFLIGAENVYDRINGFPPSPASLAPAALFTGVGGPLNPWWGPLYLALFAALWWLTGSFTVLQLVGPVAAAGVVLLTYAFGRRYFDRNVALLAALLLALFPTYREHAALALVEPLSALLIGGALWAFLERRTYLAALLGALVVLGKLDMIPMYFGTIVGMVVLSSRDRQWQMPARHILLSLTLPLLTLGPWVYLVYIVNQRPTTVAGGPSLDNFRIILPMMLEQLFTIGLNGGMLLLGIIGAIIGFALWRPERAPSLVYRLLLCWLLLGCFVFLVYSAMPGASNNPRVFIPALPPLCLLLADGLLRMWPRLLRQVTLATIVVLFIIIGGVGTVYQVLVARAVEAGRPAWEVLRTEPRGYVLAEQYWYVALYSHQPVTWFQSDPAFQHNILHNRENFQRYLAAHPIRYVVLPRSQAAMREFMQAPLMRWYRSLPIGREVEWAVSEYASADVRTYLEATYPQRVAGDFVIFTLPARQ